MQNLSSENEVYLNEHKNIFIMFIIRESSFNMTKGGDEDIETRSLKF